jgi:hypothetical protein
MTNEILPQDENEIIERLRAELSKSEPSRRRRIAEKVFLAALGSIPWVGGFLAAAAKFKAEEVASKHDSLQTRWLEEHHGKLVALKEDMEEIQRRFDALGNTIDERIQSEEYLGIVRKAFRIWDEAETKEKRRYSANLIVNSAGTRVCSDDVVRLFLDWLDLYHEAHFAVVREIFQNPGITRFEIWSNLWGEVPREDSAEADLFKLLIRDLSTGSVIRQHRDTDGYGRFVRKTPARQRRGQAPNTLESAFDDTKAYVLTEMGKQFVHYTMNEVVGRLDGRGET